MKKRIVALMLAAVAAASLTACGNAESSTKESAVSSEAESEEKEASGEAETEEAKTEEADAETAAVMYVDDETWSDEVSTALNDFIAEYGDDSENYNENAYVVFDFDNTCSIFDIEEQLAIYQLQTMSFEIAPEQMPDVLATGLSELDADLTELGYGNGSYNDWISDITAAYTNLYNTYGPFTAEGLSEEAQAEVQGDPQWQEFATKMRAMYDLVNDNESASVAYPWILYWFTGMTEDELYSLAYASHEYYSGVETSTVTWTSPADIESKVGVVEYEWTSGINVSDNIVNLWKTLDEEGIDVWACSASDTDVVRAAIDLFGMHDYCTGLIAMTNKTADGVYVNEYDYETGYAWYAEEGGEWIKGDVATQAQTQGIGKVTAINNVLVSEYGQGPLAGFMDSTGDFNFCTEYETLKLVVCFNRASRKVTDGGGLAAEVAVYQNETLGYDLASANEAGDTYYVLQGRDENGMRTLRSSEMTLTYGSDEEKLFRDEDNEAQLQYMIDNKMTTEDIFNTFAISTAEDDENNVLGFKYGFLDEYAGYHSRKAGAEADI